MAAILWNRFFVVWAAILFWAYKKNSPEVPKWHPLEYRSRYIEILKSPKICLPYSNLPFPVHKLVWPLDYIHAVFSSPSSRPGLLTTALSNIDSRKHKFVCLVWFGFIIIRKRLGSIHTPKYRLQFYLDMI